MKAYDPAKSRNGKQHVRYAAKHAMEDEEPLSGPYPHEGRVRNHDAEVNGEKRNPRPRQYRQKKPDLDNLLKLVKDACSSVVYLDDNSIVMVTARKIQCAQGEAPFSRICFEELEELSASSSDSS